MTNEQIFQEYRVAMLASKKLNDDIANGTGVWEQDDDDNFTHGKAERDAAKAQIREHQTTMNKLMTLIEAMPNNDEKRQLWQKYMK